MPLLPNHTPILCDLLRAELKTGQIMLDLAATERSLREEHACRQALHKAVAALTHVKQRVPALRISSEQRMEFIEAARELEARIEDFEGILRNDRRQRLPQG
ncbi:MAG TPA: hypothetical protein VGS58_12075 [Candidatus Sulfopaludibacter sp.]|nr:hypothetical protein [Candidatus Sulfopaludibacter sp.]